ncbi:hypothetical protein KC845_04125 [Candidatus Kaiserbacteria bacterium]|nr:hypothetical protein [Candidatus Kaiserbacteria bacterium]
MNKEFKTTEDLLRAGQKTGLSLRDRNEMWRQLSDYADFHPLKGESRSRPKSLLTTVRSLVVTKWGPSLVALVFVTVLGSGFLSTKSLPGDALYSMKVEVVEPINGLLYFSDRDELNYHVDLMERRLFEMQELSQAEKLTPTEVEILGDQLAERTSDISDLLEQQTDETILPAESLETLSNAVAVVRAQNFIEDRQIDDKTESKLDVVADEINELYKAEVADLLNGEEEQVTEYIYDVLDEMSDDIEEVTPSVLSSESELGDYLSDVSGALEEGDLEKALLYTGEAKQLLDFNNYLEVKEIETEDPVDA